jgi:hypothetical protein
VFAGSCELHAYARLREDNPDEVTITAPITIVCHRKGVFEVHPSGKVHTVDVMFALCNTQLILMRD